MVSRIACTKEAERIEKHAKESLQSWIIIGCYSKYSEYMEKAYLLRKAAKMATKERNHYMKEKGLL